MVAVSHLQAAAVSLGGDACVAVSRTAVDKKQREHRHHASSGAKTAGGGVHTHSHKAAPGVRLVASLIENLFGPQQQQPQQQPSPAGSYPGAAAASDATEASSNAGTTAPPPPPLPSPLLTAAAAVPRLVPPCAADPRAPPLPYDPDVLLAALEEEAKAVPYDPCYARPGPRAAVDAHGRLLVLDWLVEVADELKVGQGTLFLAVNYFDRGLSAAAGADDDTGAGNGGSSSSSSSGPSSSSDGTPPLTPAAATALLRRDLQRAALAALWLACKFREAYPPALSDFAGASRGTLTTRDLLAAERALLASLRFCLSVPTPATFLRLYLPAAAANAADADALLSAAIDDDDSKDDTAGGGGVGGSASSTSSGGASLTAGLGSGSGCYSLPSMGSGSSFSMSSNSSAGGDCVAGSGGGGIGGGSGGCDSPCARALGAPAGASGRFCPERNAARGPPPAADARAGPRAAPAYPYTLGSPTGVPPARAGGGRGSCPKLSAPPSAATVTIWKPSPLPAGALGAPQRRLAFLAEYLLELGLLSPDACGYPPSLLAAGALSVALDLLGGGTSLAALSPAAAAAVARAGPAGGALTAGAAAELRRVCAYAARAPRPPSVRFKYLAAARLAVAATPVPAHWA